VLRGVFKDLRDPVDVFLHLKTMPYSPFRVKLATYLDMSYYFIQSYVWSMTHDSLGDLNRFLEAFLGKHRFASLRHLSYPSIPEH
jgi:hypothetical protein